MKKILLSVTFIAAFCMFVPQAHARRSSFGSYNYGRSTYHYSAPRNYNYGGQLRYQNGYFRRSGTYVQPHFKTYPDSYKFNNRKNLFGF